MIDVKRRRGMIADDIHELVVAQEVSHPGGEDAQADLRESNALDERKAVVWSLWLHLMFI